ncbi:hypothetical protein ABTY61_37575 [Kitasatospora sp. NPDC096128]|uniref:hypothetical protein n=1 Tax=Kitasatospora sp. NPDC096128 TaxID=3155547 RepID=UPI00332B54D1
MGRDHLEPAEQRPDPADLPPPDQVAASREAANAWRRLFAAPPPLGAEHVQATHELDLAVTLILAQPEAAPSLELLTDSRRIHPEGALVLGALLQVTGHRDAAQFWWEFAAGGGSYTAASCLNLMHRSRGEIRDADWWRDQAETMADHPRPSVTPTVTGRSLLPAHVRDDIVTRSAEGLDVRLPARIAAVIHQLPVAGEDEDYGEIPQPPGPQLLWSLAAAGAAYPAPPTTRPAPSVLWYAGQHQPSQDPA